MQLGADGSRFGISSLNEKTLNLNRYTGTALVNDLRSQDKVLLAIANRKKKQEKDQKSEDSISDLSKFDDNFHEDFD